MLGFPAAAAGLPDIAQRLWELEQGQALSLRLWRSLSEQVINPQANPGPESELAQLLADNAAERTAIVEQIRDLLIRGQKPAVVKLFREVAGLTWDQAHGMTSAWPSLPLERRLRWLRVVQLRRALDRLAGQPTA